MSKKKDKHRRDDRRLHEAKADIGAVLEQCSNPELNVVIRFLERKEFDAVNKMLIILSAAYDIRAARHNERIAELAAARKLNRPQRAEEPMPQVPIPDSAKPQH